MGKAERDQPPMRRWCLYVDESGDFSKEEDAVAVAGLLLREGPCARPADLEQELRRKYPELPWPLHARSYNQPLAVALAAYGSQRRRGAEGPLGELGRRAFEALTARGPALAPELRALIDELVGKGDAEQVPLEHAGSLRRALRMRAPDLVQELEAFERRLIEALTQTLNGLGKDRATAWVVAAGEDAPPVGSPASPGEGVPGDRYLALLELLLVRARQLVAREGADQLDVEVLRRDVRDPVLTRRSPLRHQQVSELARRSPLAPAVRLVRVEVPKYEKATLPLVLADFVANRARRIFRNAWPTRSLREVEEGLWWETHGVVRSGQPARTHLVAAAPRAVALPAVEDSGGGETGRLWVRQQALEWPLSRGGL